MDGWYVHVFQLVFKKGVIWGNLEGLAWLFYYSFSIFSRFNEQSVIIGLSSCSLWFIVYVNVVHKIFVRCQLC